MTSTSRSQKRVKADVIGPGDFPCGPCAADSKVLLAVGYCQFCRHYLCKTCLSYHQNLGKAHVLLDKDSMPREVSTPAPNLDPLLENCREHKQKILELYCKTHDEVCCVICATMRHKNCDYVYIPDFTSSLTSSPLDECSTILTMTQALIGQLEHVKNESIKRLKDMDRQRRDFGLAVRRYRKEIDIVLEQLEKQVMGGMKQVIDINTKDLNDNIQKCEMALETLRVGCKKTESAIKADRINQSFTISKINHRQIQVNSAVLKDVRSTSINVDVTFDENFEILKNLRKTKMFGKVSVKKEPVRFESVLTEERPNNISNGPIKRENSGKTNGPIKNENADNRSPRFEKKV